ALRPRASWNDAVKPGRHGERKIHASGDARTQLISDQTRQFVDRTTFRGCAQKTLVGDSLLIEREHIRDGGPGIEKCDRWISKRARGQRTERTQALHGSTAIVGRHVEIEI